MNRFAIVLMLLTGLQSHANSPKDMFSLCSVDDGTLTNVGEFPRWLPQPGSVEFITMDNLTSRQTQSHPSCARSSKIAKGHFENDGESCHLSAKGQYVYLTLDLQGTVVGKLEIRNGVEVTNFVGSAPVLAYRREDGSIFLDFELTRLCRRRVSGQLTDEILIEAKSNSGYHSYLILDVYPSNI